MSELFNVPVSIEDTVRDVAAYKQATKTAINGVRMLGPHIANQVGALLELSGVDEAAAESISDDVFRKSSEIAEHLQAINLALTSIGGKVAYAYQAYEENNAKRKTTARTAGVTRSSAGGAGSKALNV